MRRIKLLWRLWKCNRAMAKLGRIFTYLVDRDQIEAARVVLGSMEKIKDEIDMEYEKEYGK